MRPLRSAGVRFDRYSCAVGHLDPPQPFESRPSYRLLGSALPDRLGFGLAASFDALDVCDAVGHEIAAVCMADPTLLASPSPRRLAGQLVFRDLIGDPFDLQRRAIIPTVTTLTIRLRRYPAQPSFLLGWRDPTTVATTGGAYGVVPTGEFQPSGAALWDRRTERNDCDLWRAIVRNYSEQLLGTPAGTRARPIDYDNWQLYQRLTDGLRDGSITAHLLGLGLDALSLAATILTVVVIDDDAFQRTFGAVVGCTTEGGLVSAGSDSAAEGVPFTKTVVDRLLNSEPITAPAAACLALAWEHKSALLGL